MRWFILFVLLVIPSLAGQPGIGLATPATERITVESFPFTYQDQFRVYNKGQDERVFVISISAPFQDVLDWVTVDTSVFTLLPGETKVIQFSIYAESGYQGEYTVTFKPTLLPTQTVPTPDSAMAHLAMSAAYTLTLIVPENVAPPRPQEAEVPPEQPRELTKTVEEIKETKATAVRPFDRPLLINVPPETYQFVPTPLTVKFAEGGEPAELKFMLVSPAGKKYALPSDSVFTFNERGSWSVLILIKDEIIAGNPIEVKYSLATDMRWRILPDYGMFIAGGAVVLLLLFVWRKRR